MVNWRIKEIKIYHDIKILVCNQHIDLGRIYAIASSRELISANLRQKSYVSTKIYDIRLKITPNPIIIFRI